VELLLGFDTKLTTVEPEDPAAVPEKLRRTRFRVSEITRRLAVWCGRNEGVPQPILNQGRRIDADGGRNAVLHADFEPGEFTKQWAVQNTWSQNCISPVLNHGFSGGDGDARHSDTGETGERDSARGLWPISDNWAYHDWHQSANGDMTPFMAELEKEFGAPTSLEDLSGRRRCSITCKHRAVFRG